MKKKLDGESATSAPKCKTYVGGPIGDGASGESRIRRAEHEQLVLSSLCLLYIMLLCILSVILALTLMSSTLKCPCKADVHAILSHSQQN